MNKRGRTKEDIFNVLKDRIVTLQYEPGKILNEIELSEEFGVSRTPIRTVFQQLESIKLVDIVPRYGVQVATLNFLNIKSLFEVTKVLDPLATKLAVSKLTDEDIKQLKEIVSTLETYDTTKNYQEAILLDEKFHKIVTKSCANPWLIDILTDLHCQTERLWHYCDIYFSDMEIFTRTFKKIVEAFENKDEEMAEKYDVTEFRATKYLYDEDGKFTGEIVPMWHSEAKDKVCSEIIEKYNIDIDNSYAYGDTTGDLSMLKKFGNAYTINPSKRLLEKIRNDEELSKKVNIIVERKDVIYKLKSDVITL